VPYRMKPPHTINAWASLLLALTLLVVNLSGDAGDWALALRYSAVGGLLAVNGLALLAHHLNRRGPPPGGPGVNNVPTLKLRRG
jgi:hypothetical protein